MSGRFFDSNVPIYLLASDVQKSEQAEAVLANGGIVSVQVLNEITNVARKKLRLDWSRLASFFADLDAVVEVVPLTRAVHDRGLRLAEQHHVHIYDAMILAAALEADCDVLYSEDMHAGLLVDGRLRIVNPFA